MEALEDHIIAQSIEACKKEKQMYATEHVWIHQLDKKSGRNFHIHAIHIFHPSQTKNKDVIFLVIHGAASTSASFANCFGHLHQHFSSTCDIWALDLPGFGRSSVDDIPHPERAMDVFLTAVDMLLLKIKKSPLKDKSIIILGHSFGTFVASNFAIRNPTLIKKLVLVAPIGMLPTLDTKGFYWAFFFRDILPLICDMAYVEKQTDKHDYWAHVLGNCENSWGNRPEAGIGSYVYFSVLHGSSTWTSPVAHLLTEKQIPVSCIFAENDVLVPMHQKRVLGCTCRIVRVADHVNIIHGKYAEELCRVVAEEVKTNEGSVLNVPSTLDWKEFESSPVPSRTRQIIERLYDRILKERH
jgi:pimeloyl-ACP methyl ester carboxylesterase